MEAATSDVIATQLGHHLVRHQLRPVVLRDMIGDWPAAKWTVESLGKLLGNETVRFRIGRHQAVGKIFFI